MPLTLLFCFALHAGSNMCRIPPDCLLGTLLIFPMVSPPALKQSRIHAAESPSHRVAPSNQEEPKRTSTP